MRTPPVRLLKSRILAVVLLGFLCLPVARALAQGGGVVEGSVVGKDDGRAVAGATVSSHRTFSNVSR